MTRAAPTDPHARPPAFDASADVVAADLPQLARVHWARTGGREARRAGAARRHDMTKIDLLDDTTPGAIRSEWWAASD